MNKYHHKISITWGCGCRAENAVPIREGYEPTAKTAYVSLIDTLYLPDVALMGLEDHEEAGGEVIDIKVRTKVGWPE